jgi:SAM-dependent methyltransferase
MGINTTSAEFLLQAHAAGVSFGNTLTLGRQNLSVNDNVLKGLLKRYGVSGFEKASAGRDPSENLKHGLPPYADSFFQTLGAAKIDSIDADAYQDSSIVHDMNLPIPPDLHQQYDCVVDGGTLEHVFAFPTAIRNCMEMVKPGGHLILLTPANNFFGHGFYQFSPELFFRVLSPENGFCVERMIVIETENLAYRTQGRIYSYEEHGRPYEVLDPAVTRKRGTLRNSKSVLLYVQAKRQADVPIFTKAPQQSDYVTLWHESEQGRSPQPSVRFFKTLRARLKEFVPPYFMVRYYQRLASLRNRDFFGEKSPIVTRLNDSRR